MVLGVDFTSTSGGGSAKTASGKILSTDWDGATSTSTVKVTLDFEPKQIYWYNPNCTYHTFYVYDKDIDPTKYTGQMYTSWSSQSVGNPNNYWNGLKAVDSTSFTLSAYAVGYSDGDIYWTAIG